MMVAGLMKQMTAESAERAALGAGAIVMKVISYDDDRSPLQKIKLIRELRPDMILFAGGTDGGDTTRVAEMTEIMSAADPVARLGTSYQLPLIWAGNKDVQDMIKEKLDKKFALKICENIRPTIAIENTTPARNAIHVLFMEHVMSHAPGYNKLMKWTPIPIMPTPMGEGIGFQTIAKMYEENVIGVGLGGATTNVYSIFDEKFVRTVSANLGMSYSIGNVLKQTGVNNIIRWLPFKIENNELRNLLFNKMIRPTILPETLRDLLIEHAVAREALRMGLEHHKLLARPLRGKKISRDLDKFFDQKDMHESYIKMMDIDWIGGTGGLLSHAPRRIQSAMLLIDGFQPEGITKLAQDSVFMMPHLGVLSTVQPQAAMEIFEKDCLVRLGTVIAPKGKLKEGNLGKDAMKISIELPEETIEETIVSGILMRIPLKEGEVANVELSPKSNFDLGKGLGKSVKSVIQGGVVGIIIDTRGRPIYNSPDQDNQRKMQIEWLKALDVYPKIPGMKEE